MTRWFGVLLVTLGVALPGWAQGALVKAELLADHSAVRPGEIFEVGVRLNVAPGWHVYWKYPGDSGLATSVQWTVPDGVTVSHLQWPTPKRSVLPGDIEAIGYEGEVMLIATVTPPAGFSGSLPIEANVSWLSCNEQCLPGKAKLKVNVEVGGGAQETNRSEFAAWRKRIPVDAQPTISVQGQTYRVELPTDAEKPQAFVAPPEEMTVKQEIRDGVLQVTLTPMAGSAVSGKPAEVVVDLGHERAIRFWLPTERAKPQG